MKDISVIIPVYNAERFLPRCLDSILKEKIESMEVLLINDGSTDASADICMRYAAEDPRVIYSSQGNLGAVAARNRGMDMACGAYLLFVDADDYISPEYVRSLHETALTASADIAFSHIRRMRQETVVEATDYRVERLTRLSEKLALLKETYYPGPYSKIYRRSLLVGNNIRFLSEEGYFGFAEDMLFTLYATYYAEKIVFCPAATYYYCMDNEHSLCSEPSVQRRNNDDRLVIINHMLRFALEKELHGEELLPILQAVENHLRWGGMYTLDAFILQLDAGNSPREIREYFHRFAREWKGRETPAQRFNARLKALLLHMPALYKLASTVRERWRGIQP